MTEEDFDMNEWVESVNGKVVEVTSPGDGQLGPKSSMLMSSMSPHEGDDNYCSNCDEFVRLVKNESAQIGHCPICGTKPGMLELGTKRRNYA